MKDASKVEDAASIAVKYSDEIAGGVEAVLKHTDDAADTVEAAGKNTLTKTHKLTPTQTKVLSNKEFGTLLEDIRSNGIREPIKYVNYNGEMYVVDGHHRLLAAKMLGITDVPAEEVKLPYKSYRTPDDLFWGD